MAVQGGKRLSPVASNLKQRSRVFSRGVAMSREGTLVLLILAACIAICVFKPMAFLDSKNFEAMATGMIYDLLMASGMTLVLITGGIDLSVGSVLALTGVVTTMFLQKGTGVAASLSLGLAVSTLAGAVNGFCIARLKVAPFIVTLATMSVARGGALVLTSGYYVSSLPDSYLAIGRGELWGIPYPVYAVILILVVFGYLLRNWKPLNQAFYIGSNPKAAVLAGIPVGTVVFFSYIICSLFAGAAAIFMTSRLAMGYSGFGMMAELRAIAAAVIGGASLKGGTGSIVGTFLGVVLLVVINNGFVLFGCSPNWQQVVSGAILVAAVGVDAWRRIRTESN